MKKFIAILLGTMFVLALAGSVYAADLRIGGDAYVEGVWTNNYGNSAVEPFDSKERNDNRYWAERVVLKADAVLENGIELRTAYDIVGGFCQFDPNAGNDRQGAEVCGSGLNGPAIWGRDSRNYPGKPSTANNSFDTAQPVQTEYAYLHVPLGNFTVDAGHMLGSWGDGFDMFETPADRVKVYYKVNDMLTIGAYTSKDWERLSTDYGRGDMNTYEVEAVVKPNDYTTAGVELAFTQDEEDYLTSTATVVAGSGDGPYHMGNTFKIDGFVNTKVGPVAIMSEMVYKSFSKAYDMTTNITRTKADAVNQFGGFILGQADVAPVTLTGAVTWATNGYSADDDFQPTLLFGTRNNPLGLINVQSLANDRTTWAALAAADFKANDCTTLHGLVAYASLGDPGSRSKALDLVELDATMKYQISKSTAYTIGATVGLPSNMPSDLFEGKKDPIFGVMHRLSLSF